MFKDYDCEILYQPGKANVVVDALSHKLDNTSVGGLCLRILSYLPLLYLIREAQAEGARRKSWMQERIRGEIDRFYADHCRLLTRYGRVWVPDFGMIRQTVMVDAHQSRFFINPGAIKMYRD